MTGRARLPALVLGGSTGALAVTRELAAHGVAVHLSTRSTRPELRTRRAAVRHGFDAPEEAAALWRELLLSDRGLPGPVVVLPCDDDGVEFVGTHHAELSRRHVLDHARPEHLLGFLDKARTAELAAGTGVRVPRSWAATPELDAEAVLAEARGPVLLKPLHSHLFQREFGSGGRKYFLAEDPTEVRAQLQRLQDAGVEALVMELIPGPDHHSTTYYAYRSATGATLFEFIKRLVRRYPRNEGPGTLHVVEWDEQVALEGRRLLDALDYRGYANIEFKRDARDGRLVLIELNPRFTASQVLLRRSGIPAATVVYDHLTGVPRAPLPRPQEGLLLWDPWRDLRAFRQHRRAEGLTLRGWLGSLRGERVHLLLDARDPLPALARLGQLMRRAVSR